MFLAPATPGNSRIGLPQRVGDGAVRNESSGERIDHSETVAAVGLPPPRQPKHEGWQRSSGSRTGGAIAGLLAGSPAVLVGAGTCRRSPRNGFSLPHCSERQPCSCSTNRWRRREAAEASYVITSRRHPYGIHVRRRDKTGMIQPFRGLTCPSSAPKISPTRTSSSAGRLMPREQPCHLPPRIAGRDCTVRAPSRDSSWTVTILAAVFGRVISTG